MKWSTFCFFLNLHHRMSHKLFSSPFANRSLRVTQMKIQEDLWPTSFQRIQTSLFYLDPLIKFTLIEKDSGLFIAC